MTPPLVEIVEFTDPICSWAWGAEPKLRLLRWRYGGRLRWRRVLAGIFGDVANYRDDFDAVADAPKRSRYWRRVWEHTGMSYPVRLEYDIASSHPGCLAAKAAEPQGDDVADRVLRRLREAVFVYGRPVTSVETASEAVRGVAGLDEDRYARDLGSPEVEAAFRADWQAAREPNDYVRSLEPGPPGGARFVEGHWRYVTPTLLVRGERGEQTVPGWQPFERHVEAMEAVQPGSAADPRPDPSPEDAFATWPTLAPKELEVLCGPGARPPDDVLAYDWGEGIFYVTAEEAERCGRDLSPYMVTGQGRPRR